MSFQNVTEQFRTNGYAVIPDFLSDNEVSSLLEEMTKVVDKGQQLDSEGSASVFETGANQSGDKYFIESGDKIRFFFEKDAFGTDGKLVDNVHKSLNKVGHALHWLSPVFKGVTFSGKMKDLVRSVVEFKRPVVPQSMFIYKNPGIGGIVVPHQDASFLFTRPTVQLLGIWIALSDATIENGCLWFIPGSHRDEISRRFIRNPGGSTPLIFTKEAPNYPPEAFVAAPVQKGSCVLIHGLVCHKSERNCSEAPRPAYTFHVVDTDGVEWAEDNWLQPTENLAFPSLYDN